MVHQDNLAAGLSTRANSSSVASGSGTAVNDVLRDDHVEELVGKREMLGVHHGERLDIVRPYAATRFLRLAQHRGGDIDADDAVGAGVVGKRDAGADATSRMRPPTRSAAAIEALRPALEHLAEDEIVDRAQRA